MNWQTPSQEAGLGREGDRQGDSQKQGGRAQSRKGYCSACCRDADKVWFQANGKEAAGREGLERRERGHQGQQ